MSFHPRKNRETVLHLHFYQKVSYREIEKQTGVPRSICQDWCTTFIQTKKTETVSSPGRPRTVKTQQTIRKVETWMKNKKKIRSVKKASIQFNVSRASIHHIIRNEIGLQAVKLKKRPKLSEQHKQRRIDFAHSDLNTDISNWVFTDEKHFYLHLKPNGNDFIWTDDSTKDITFVDTTKYGSGSVEVWGAITKYGLPDLFFIERPHNSSFTAVDFCNQILQTQLPLFVEMFHQQEDSHFVFVQDGDSKHNAQIVKNCLNEMAPEFIGPPEWPANSPDLNLIENV